MENEKKYNGWTNYETWAIAYGSTTSAEATTIGGSKPGSTQSGSDMQSSS